MLNGLSDDDHKKKYYAYLLTHGITIVSDIFERMDNDRRIIESLRKLQAMDGLSEEEFYKKKAALMRKLTAQATKFLYEKAEKNKGITLREMAARKEHEERMKRAGRDVNSLQPIIIEKEASAQTDLLHTKRNTKENQNASSSIRAQKKS
jgi:hypothetical protein